MTHHKTTNPQAKINLHHSGVVHHGRIVRKRFHLSSHQLAQRIPKSYNKPQDLFPFVQYHVRCIPQQLNEFCVILINRHGPLFRMFKLSGPGDPQADRNKPLYESLLKFFPRYRWGIRCIAPILSVPPFISFPLQLIRD